jgi:hypothetical protein
MLHMGVQINITNLKVTWNTKILTKSKIEIFPFTPTSPKLELILSKLTPKFLFSVIYNGWYLVPDVTLIKRAGGSVPQVCNNFVNSLWIENTKIYTYSMIHSYLVTFWINFRHNITITQSTKYNNLWDGNTWSVAQVMTCH